MIAVIGWGSLIWAPGTLELSSPWHLHGPLLPLEFARISSRGRLTLVITEVGVPQSTYWAIAAMDNMEAVVEAVKLREKTPSVNFAVSNKAGLQIPLSRVDEIMSRWLSLHPELEGCVWTGLPSNWLHRRLRPFSIDDAIDYLSGLEDSTAAREYVENAPEGIQTPLRAAIRERLGWTGVALPANLFAD